MKIKMLFALLVFFILTVVSHSQSIDQRIIGTWVTEDNLTLVFNSNGSGTISRGDQTRAFMYGLSMSGVLRLIYTDNNSTEEWTPFISPDGRIFVRGSNIYRKR